MIDSRSGIYLPSYNSTFGHTQYRSLSTQETFWEAVSEFREDREEKNIIHFRTCLYLTQSTKGKACNRRGRTGNIVSASQKPGVQMR